jgi:capsular exopolysaccharide synthesis family protein
MSLLVALRRRWISAVLLGGTLGLLAAGAMWYLLTPKHTAFAQLSVLYHTPGILPGSTATTSDFKTYLQTTANEVISRQVIASALKRDEVKRLGLDRKELDPAQAIADDLKVEAKDNSELLTILYSHYDPTVALTVVNAIKESYMEGIVYAKRNERVGKVRELEKAYNETVEALRKKKENLERVGKNLGTTDPLLWREQRLELMGDLKDSKHQAATIGFELIKAQAALDTLDARIKAYKDRTAPGATPPAFDKATFEAALDEALEKDVEARQLRERISAYEEAIDDYINVKRYRPDYFAVVAFRDKANNVRRQLDKRKETVAERVKKTLARAATPPTGPMAEDPGIMRAQLQKQVNALETLEENLSNRIKELTKQAARTPVLAAEYEQNADEIKREEETLRQIGHNLDREKVEMRAASRIRSFQDAELLKREIKKQVLAAGVAPIAVLGAVCMGLAWFEFRKRRVRSASEISRGLGIRVVGAVPQMPNLERQLVSLAGENELEGTPVMESIDAIRTRLLHEANTRSTRVVMVTSAGPGEGKTTLASALATSLARAGRKTLLLDGDLRRPTVHELFEVAMQPGLSEVLLGEIEVAEVAQESMQENLSLIPAGQWDREVLLALSRDGLEGIFERLAEEFDFIVVDSHPVLSATDSLLIGRQADAVLLSVLREVSQMPRVYAAQQQLAAVGIRVLGAVVNGTSPEEVYTSPAVPVAVA